MEGVLLAGFGMFAYLAHVHIAAGANLVCTVLMKSLANMVEAGRPLGSSLRVHVDKTTAENKNGTVIGMCAWLVQAGKFEDVTIFFMPVGHTFNALDQSFRPLIQRICDSTIATVDDVVEVIKDGLREHDADG